MASVYIENLGCAKNQVDAEVMGARLEDAGWTWTDVAEQADLIVINTCGFIEPAQQESIDTTLAFLNAYPDTPVTLAGCMAQRYADELAGGMPEIAGVFGNREPHRIDVVVRRITDHHAEHGPLVWVPEGEPVITAHPRNRLLSHPGSAFIKIAEGCNHSCSFCAIPSIRGRLRLRPVGDILREFRELRAAGIFEFNLIAQDLAAWRDGGDGFPALISALLAEPGEFWLRPLYLYPDTFPEELLAIAASDARLLPYFDLSFQHASRSVLRRMGRPGDAAAYLALIQRIRAVLPDAALRSSFIVGFPGETDEDIAELRSFLETARLEWVGVFEYSAQDGTPAAAMRDPVSAQLSARRKAEIEAGQEQIVADRLGRRVGAEYTVLVEDRIQGTEIALGRSRLHAPDVDGLVVVHGCPETVVPGSVITAETTGVSGVDLQAVFRR
ncbi:MAG: 30S ribosomal protein S12 methylthiotransferase RimO [Spirochaeta sp.]|jgi:ribosomal protein S12 methylthiotransferase|nr:30S ribosomal protein S12 methylthiotransferase RimO [Spirochaeta sp.]